MKIAFDTWPTNRRFRNSGIHLYTVKLLEEFKNLAGEGKIEVGAFVGLHGVHDAEAIAPGNGFVHARSPALDRYLTWRLWGLASAAAKLQPDVIFAPHAQVIPPTTSLPVVVTLHDTTAVRTPWQMTRKLTTLTRLFHWCAARYSTQIITVSEHSKHDLVDVYNLDPAKVSVTYLGIDRHVFNASPPDPDALAPLRKRFDIHRPYLFHHGTIQPRKNLVALIHAHRLLLERDPSLEIDLVLAGPLGWLCEPVVSLAQQSPNPRGRVIFTHALEDDQLALLLKGAALCVFPSLYEGFCLPMVEAMACGVPTVASNSSCLPEVSGGVLRYFDPGAIDEMAEVISLGLHDTAERKRLAEAGIERTELFSWRRTAEQTVQVLSAASRQHTT